MKRLCTECLNNWTEEQTCPECQPGSRTAWCQEQAGEVAKSIAAEHKMLCERATALQRYGAGAVNAGMAWPSAHLNSGLARLSVDQIAALLGLAPPQATAWYVEAPDCVLTEGPKDGNPTNQ